MIHPFSLAHIRPCWEDCVQFGLPSQCMPGSDFLEQAQWKVPRISKGSPLIIPLSVSLGVENNEGISTIPAGELGLHV